MFANRSLFLCFIALCANAQSFAAALGSTDDAVKMNQIQVIGTHNSYHAGLAPSEAKLMLDIPVLFQSGIDDQ